MAGLAASLLSESWFKNSTKDLLSFLRLLSIDSFLRGQMLFLVVPSLLWCKCCMATHSAVLLTYVEFQGPQMAQLLELN